MREILVDLRFDMSYYCGKQMSQTAKVSVYCIWRNNIATIDNTLNQLSELNELDYDFEYFFYENDSNDGTDKILSQWIKDKQGKLLSETLEVPHFGSNTSIHRMNLLSECRNKCKDLNPDISSDYTLLIDSDIIFNKGNFAQQMRTLNAEAEVKMVTPNVRQNIPDFMSNKADDSYYDIHAFLDKNGDKGNYYSDCPFKNAIDIMNWSLNQPVACQASFGGFALLYSSIFKQCRWSTIDFNNGQGLCEHIPLCRKILEFGKIYIDPASKVFTELDLSTINLNACRNFAHHQR